MGDPSDYSKSLGGKMFLEQKYDIHTLNRHVEEGFMIRKTTLTEQYTFEDFLQDDIHKTIPLFAVGKDNNLIFSVIGAKRNFEQGTTIVSLTSPTRKIEKALEKANNTENISKE